MVCNKLFDTTAGLSFAELVNLAVNRGSAEIKTAGATQYLALARRQDRRGRMKELKDRSRRIACCQQSRYQVDIVLASKKSPTSPMVSLLLSFGYFLLYDCSTCAQRPTSTSDMH